MCFICTDDQYTFSDRAKVQLAKKLNLDKVVEDAINQLYNDRKVTDEINQTLFESHYEPLKKAVEEGYGKPIVKIEYGTPNFEFLKQLQVNTAVFAIFKNHASIKEMTSLLKDEQGNLRTREQFVKEALKVDSKYRVNYLNNEYDTAVRSARMAANWQRYQRNKRLYPNLRYVQTKAAKPDPKHLVFVGIVASMDDPFWNQNYPPNRWKCQCSVEPTDDPATDIPDNLPEPDPQFAFNSGKTGQVFDIKNSEYIKSVDPKEQPALIRNAEKYVNKQIAATVEYQRLYTSKKGGSVDGHPLSFDNSDFDQVLSEARSLTNNIRKAIKILPDIQDQELRSQLTPKGAKAKKSPDYVINENEVADLKILDKATRTAIRDAFKRCYEQCNNIVLKVTPDNPVTSQELYRYSKGALNVGYSSMQTIYIDFKGNWYQTTRKDILAGKWPIKDNSR